MDMESVEFGDRSLDGIRDRSNNPHHFCIQQHWKSRTYTPVAWAFLVVSMALAKSWFYCSNEALGTMRNETKASKRLSQKHCCNLAAPCRYLDARCCLCSSLAEPRVAAQAHRCKTWFASQLNFGGAEGFQDNQPIGEASLLDFVSGKGIQQTEKWLEPDWSVVWPAGWLTNSAHWLPDWLAD